MHQMDGGDSQPQTLGLQANGLKEETKVTVPKEAVPSELNVKMNLDGLKDVKKQYKKLKKYMRSPLFAIRVMDGNEKIVSKLVEDLQEGSVS